MRRENLPVSRQLVAGGPGKHQNPKKITAAVFVPVPNDTLLGAELESPGTNRVPFAILLKVVHHYWGQIPMTRQAQHRAVVLFNLLLVQREEERIPLTSMCTIGLGHLAQHMNRLEPLQLATDVVVG